MNCHCEKLAADLADLAPVCIGHLWLFRDLPPETLAAMSHTAVRLRKGKGESLFLEGDPAETMYLLKGGRIKLSKISESGDERVLGYRKPGDFIGENLIGDGGLYPCSAWCLEETLVCGFTRQQFQQLVLTHPHIGLQIIRNMSERITWLTDQVGNLTVTNIGERLHRVLRSVAREQGKIDQRGVVLNFPLTHEELGFLIGAHRVSVTRAMAALRQTGRIRVDGKELIISPLP
jgi:CRP/FNR family transcriptional regulator